ncbi:hypothetical protein [Ascidiimonas sp. W6]|uniref:hypothetical protein n=1 Tax=Ascidiimonas meishanensis TaxID=3128903 RepID=UPI0030EE102B
MKILGKVLSKREQKSIYGGKFCISAEECGEAPFDQLQYAPPSCVNNRCSW